MADLTNSEREHLKELAEALQYGNLTEPGRRLVERERLIEILEGLMNTGFIKNAEPCVCAAGHGLPKGCARCEARKVLAAAKGSEK